MKIVMLLASGRLNMITSDSICLYRSLGEAKHVTFFITLQLTLIKGKNKEEKRGTRPNLKKTAFSKG
jgi:hypothetical protein